MYPLITLFVEIASFRKGPQDVPASPLLLKLLLPLYLLTNFLLGSINNGWQVTSIQLLIDLGLLLTFTWPLLYFAGKLARFSQTIVALLGTDIVISFCAIPVMASFGSDATDLTYFAMLLLMVWHWLVSGHIFRHALDRPLFLGLALAFLYILIFFQISALLLPETVVTQPGLAEDL